MCNKSNHSKIAFNLKTTAFNLMLPAMFDWIDERMNGSSDVWWNQRNNEWEWWSMKAIAERICN